MKKSCKVVLLVSLLALFANAQEAPQPPQDEKNLRVVAYLHPLPFFVGAAYNMFMFNSTVEVPLSLSNSVVIQPAIWLGSSDGFILDAVEYENLKRFGSGVGLRHYINNKGYGFYFQGVASLYYLHAESIQYKEDDDGSYWDYEIKTWKKVKGTVGELMFYIGAAHKWQNMSLSYEGGLGFGLDGTKTYQLGYVNKLATNFNICIGIPF